MQAVRLLVHGRVQSVGYRFWTVRTATELGIRGWVCNRRDGSVEILAVGTPEAVERLTEACRSGPAYAEVTAVDTHAAADDGSVGFSQRPSA